MCPLHKTLYIDHDSHDVSPSILEHLPSDLDLHKDHSEPSAKRAKLVSNPPSSTIDAKVRDGAYSTFHQFTSDLHNAARHIVETLQDSLDTFNQTDPWRLLLDTLGPEDLKSRLQSLEGLGQALSYREERRLALGNQDRNVSSQESRTPTGVKKEEEDYEDKFDSNSRNVLTLYGSAQGHKQLFSSLQRPPGHDHPTKSRKTVSKLRESGLPNGISSTKVFYQDTATTKHASSFQDLFAPPASVPPLNPPKTLKNAANRESTLTWSHSSTADHIARRPGYLNEKIATGHWLGYAGIAPIDEPSSPQAKRRQRDRALSMGAASATDAAKPNPPSTVQNHAKGDALFRSAFSSFAPTHDNSAVLVPEVTKSDLWWQRFGREFFDGAFGVEDEPLTTGGEESSKTHETITDADEDAVLAKAVADFDPALEPVDHEGQKLLNEVSEMIETLYSFQRIRMSSMATGSRPGMSYAAGQESSNPAVPSTVEIETYRTLQAQLALIVGTLPPYVVSKLNGDQLDELNIKAHIAMEVPNHRGVMEEDQASRLAKQQAFQAAVGSARGQGQNAASTPVAQSQNRPLQAAQTTRPVVPANTKGGSTFARQHLSSWQTPQNQSMTVQRPPYANPQAFNQARPGMQSPMQRPNYPQSAPRLQQAQPNGLYQSSQQTGQQPRPPNYGVPYAPQVGQSLQSGFTPRPQMQYSQQQQQQQQQRPLIAQTPTPQAQSASPQPKLSVGPPNGLSRPQTPLTPLTSQQSTTPAPILPPGVSQLSNGKSMSGTPQPPQKLEAA